MNGYQFFHVETYARKHSRNGKKQSIVGLAREAERHPSACLHITKPEKPTLLFGKIPSEVAIDISTIAESALDSKGRKLRSDAQILLAGVASYPVPCKQVPANCSQLKKWLELNIKFLKIEYGGALKSIILHLDEQFPHIHFYCHPNLSNEDTLNIRDIHCGMKLRDSVKDKGIGSGKLRSRLYKQAMRDQQDRYYQQIGIECGLTRIGPKTRKLTRKEWVYEQQNAKRQQKLFEAEKANKQALSSIEQEKSKNLELVTKNEQILKLVEQENIEKASLHQSFFSSGKSKLNYLKSKLEQTAKREKQLKIKVSAEIQKVTTLQQGRRTLLGKLSEKDRKVDSLEKKVSKLISKIDFMTKSIKSWKQKYFQLISSANLNRDSKPLKNNNENTFDV